ncbi:g1739 [Coccomyxa elongata]
MRQAYSSLRYLLQATGERGGKPNTQTRNAKEKCSAERIGSPSRGLPHAGVMRILKTAQQARQLIFGYFESHR